MSNVKRLGQECWLVDNVKFASDQRSRCQKRRLLKLANVFFNSIKQCKCIFLSNKYFLSIKLSGNCLTRNLARKLGLAICVKGVKEFKDVKGQPSSSNSVLVDESGQTQTSQHLLKKFSLTNL
jgi:hypothetical protein